MSNPQTPTAESIVAELNKSVETKVETAVKEATAAKADATVVTELKEAQDKALAEKDAEIKALKEAQEGLTKQFNILDEANKGERSQGVSESLKDVRDWRECYRAEAQAASDLNRGQAVVKDLLECDDNHARKFLENMDYMFSKSGISLLESRLGSADPVFKSAKKFYETLTGATSSAGALLAGASLLDFTNAAIDESDFLRYAGTGNVSEQGQWFRPIIGDGGADIVSPYATAPYADNTKYDASTGESSGVVGDAITIPRVNENLANGARFNINDYVLNPAARAIGNKVENDAINGTGTDDWSVKGITKNLLADPTAVGAARFTALYTTDATKNRTLSVNGGTANSFGQTAQAIINTLEAGPQALYSKNVAALRNARYLMNSAVFAKLRATLKGTDGANGFLFDRTYDENNRIVNRINGYPVVLSSFMPATFAGGDDVGYVFGDLNAGYTFAQPRQAYVRRLEVTPPVTRFVVKARVGGNVHDGDSVRAVILAA